MYWKVRWEASPVNGEPMRTMVVYKDAEVLLLRDSQKQGHCLGADDRALHNVTEHVQAESSRSQADPKPERHEDVLNIR